MNALIEHLLVGFFNPAVITSLSLSCFCRLSPAQADGGPNLSPSRGFQAARSALYFPELSPEGDRAPRTTSAECQSFPHGKTPSKS